jgi:hypothetical protein
VNRIADYSATVGKMRELAAGRNHQQPGDPSKLGQAILQPVHAAEPPMRLPLGTDTLQSIADKNKFVEQETAKWRTMSASTDFDEKAKAKGQV